MAIQIPNPGTGNGSTGDNEFVLWSKVKDNFSDTTHAASKIVGTGTGQVSLNNDLHKALHTTGLTIPTASADTDANTQEAGDRVYFTSTGVNTPTGSAIIETYARFKSSRKYQIAYKGTGNNGNFYYRFGGEDGTWSAWATIYSTGNTTKDTATGFLKASSPVLHVYNDKIDKIHEANQLDITVDKKGVGHYEIHGSTGLRKNDGWYMSPPRDVHGNVLCMVDLEEKDGVVILKTYKKLFDFETVSIVHDYDNPMDIPDGVCVEFRFNDLPIDDTQPEEADLDK